MRRDPHPRQSPRSRAPVTPAPSPCALRSCPGGPSPLLWRPLTPAPAAPHPCSGGPSPRSPLTSPPVSRHPGRGGPSPRLRQPLLDGGTGRPAPELRRVFARAELVMRDGVQPVHGADGESPQQDVGLPAAAVRHRHLRA